MFNDLAVLHHETQELLSRVLRSGFLVSLWSLFESSIQELVEYVRVERKLALGLDGQRSFLDQTNRFFRTTVNIHPFPNKEERKQLDTLRRFRNALAHHDGNIAKVPKELIADEGLVRSFCLTGDSHEFAVPSARYVRASVELIGRVSQSLAGKVLALMPSQNDAA